VSARGMHACELSFDFGNDQPDRFGGAGGRGDDVDGCGASALPVLPARPSTVFWVAVYE